MLRRLHPELKVIMYTPSPYLLGKLASDFRVSGNDAEIGIAEDAS